MEPKNFVAFLLIIAFPIANGSVPGTFFWKPRLGIDLEITTASSITGVAVMPNLESIQAGQVVLIDGYNVGITIVALAAGIQGAIAYRHMNPMSAYFYTNAYRWALRHLSLLPHWLSGVGTYSDTHKVWRSRFLYADEMVPKWMRNLFPYVEDEEWEQEEKEMKLFKKHTEPAFGKHYRYPSKIFNNFKSLETEETIENLDSSSS